MIVFPVPAAVATPVIGQNTESGQNRVLYISNAVAGAAATLMVDSGNQALLGVAAGIPLAPGATMRFGSTNAGDQDGNQAIYVFSTAGTTITVNSVVGKKTLP